MYQIELFEDVPIQLGWGVNYATGALHQSAVSNPEEGTSSGTNAKTVNGSIFLYESSRTMDLTNQFHARGSVTYGLFKASGALSKFLSKVTSSYELNLVINYDVSLSTLILDNPRSKYQKSDELEILDFVLTHGTHFVQGVQRGGVLSIVLRVSTRSTADKEALSQSIAAKGLFSGMGAGGAASWSSSFKEVVQGRQVTCDYFFSGGSFAVNVFDWVSVLQGGQDYPNSVTQENAVNRKVFFSGYELTSGFDGRKALEIRRMVREQTERLNELGRLKLKLLGLAADYQYILQNQQSFKDEDIAYAQSSNSTVDDLLIEIDKQATMVREDITHEPVIRPHDGFRIPRQKEVTAVVPPPPPPPPPPPFVKVIAYNGPSLTGQSVTFENGGGDFPQHLNDRMQSFEILSNRPLNAFWVTFHVHNGQNSPIQSFISTCRVNTIATGDNPSTYRVFDIRKGAEVDQPLNKQLRQASSIQIRLNEDNSQLPRDFDVPTPIYPPRL